MQSPTSCDLAHAGLLELAARDVLEVGVVAATGQRAVALEGRVDLRPGLIAAGARSRTERGLDRAGPTELAQRPDAFGQDAAGQAAPAGVHDRDGFASDQRDRDAVRGQHDERDAVQRRGLAVGVGVGERLGGIRELAHASHERLVDLQPCQRALARDPGQRREAVAIGADGVGVVGGEHAEVQRVVRRPRDTAAAGGEQRPAARQRAADVLADPFKRRGKLRRRLGGWSGRRGRGSHRAVVAGPNHNFTVVE